MNSLFWCAWRSGLCAVLLWFMGSVAWSHPGRFETGLPYSAAAKELFSPTPPQAPGQLQGELGRFKLGLLGDLFATYRLIQRQDEVFHEFELTRIQLSGWIGYADLAGANVTVDTVRSSGERSYQGISGDAILPRLKWAFAELTPFQHYLSVRAGLVPDLLLQYAEASFGYRVQGPIGLERDALYSPGDLGASIEAALPWQLGSVALQFGNGEGVSMREQNNGKNLTAALRIAPLRHKWPDLLLHFLFRDGSLGVATAQDRRGSAGLTLQKPRIGAGAIGTVALGYRGIADRYAGHVTAWLCTALPASFGLLGRVDALWPDVSESSSVSLRVIGGASYALPALARLIVSYEGTFPFGSLSAQVPSLTEHAMLLQAEVRL